MDPNDGLPTDDGFIIVIVFIIVIMVFIIVFLPDVSRRPVVPRPDPVDMVSLFVWQGRHDGLRHRAVPQEEMHD
jgi:hypothetical protein